MPNDSFHNNATTTAQITNADAAMVNDRWDTRLRTLTKFSRDFANHYLILQSKVPPPSFDAFRSYWINLLPHHFRDLKTLLDKNSLLQPRSNATCIPDLVAAINTEIHACSLKLPTKQRNNNEDTDKNNKNLDNQQKDKDENNNNNEQRRQIQNDQNNNNNDRGNLNLNSDNDKPARISDDFHYAFPSAFPTSLAFKIHLLLSIL